MQSNPRTAAMIPKSGYKHILLRKLSYAVTCSVISQLIILLWYTFILNFSLFSPLESLSTYLSILGSITTWLYILLLSTIVFAQSIICAKDYIITPRYCSTRFSKLKAIFSFHNLILLNLHVFVGFVCVWLYLGFTNYGLLDYKNGKYIIVENTLYLLYLGAWCGYFYFISEYTSEKKVLFPVVQQLKWLQFKAHLLPLLKKSQRATFWPTAYYIICYALFGRWFNEFLPVEVQQESTDDYYRIYLFAWLFATLIYFVLNLMNFYYELFLTEPFEFPIVSSHDDDFTLKEALSTNVPIIQHLACQDIFILSGTSKQRREVLFSLSSPGNHPHNWNNVADIMLNILKSYAECLNISLNHILAPEKEKPKVETPVMKSEHFLNPKIRRMGLVSSPECVGVMSLQTGNTLTATKDNLVTWMTEKLDNFTAGMKERLGINFMFKELPEASIQKCLGDGQMIIWIVQSLSCLCSFSLKEDRYGIAQKDLPVILNSLVELKISVEKLNRLPSLNRKGLGMEDFNSKMKVGILNALKRSIYNLVNNFGPYLKDMNLKQDVISHLQAFSIRNAHC